MANQTVTRAAECDLEPGGIYDVLAETSNLPKWAPGFADAIERIGDGQFRVTKGGSSFRVEGALPPVRRYRRFHSGNAQRQARRGLLARDASSAWRLHDNDYSAHRADDEPIPSLERAGTGTRGSDSTCARLMNRTRREVGDGPDFAANPIREAVALAV